MAANLVGNGKFISYLEIEGKLKHPAIFEIIFFQVRLSYLKKSFAIVRHLEPVTRYTVLQENYQFELSILH